jgi:hypothetical protein
MTVRDWRLPENRREAFQRSYSFHLKYKAHPGMVYSFLPAIAEAFDLDEDGKAWLVWLNGNTQNAVTSLMLLEAAPRPEEYEKAIAFWDEHFKLLEWDTDRRHQKSKFGEATHKWVKDTVRQGGPGDGWLVGAELGWKSVWGYSKSQPYMGRLSAWSMMEYAKILLPGIPDIGSWMLEDKAGSKSHRNSLGWIAGYDAVYWDEGDADMLGLVPYLEDLADDLLFESTFRNPTEPDVSRLTMESALCTYKSWHKPNRRYPGVYADMMYNRIRKAEARFNRTFPLLWETRKKDLPDYMRLEDCPTDPGLAPVKQNHYLQTGCPVMLHREWPDDMDDGFHNAGRFPLRKDPTWL